MPKLGRKALDEVTHYRYKAEMRKGYLKNKEPFLKYWV